MKNYKIQQKLQLIYERFPELGKLTLYTYPVYNEAGVLKCITICVGPYDLARDCLPSSEIKKGHISLVNLHTEHGFELTTGQIARVHDFLKRIKQIIPPEDEEG